MSETAGLKWPPEMEPTKRIMIPRAKPILSQLTPISLEPFTTKMMTPKKTNVPMISAKSLLNMICIDILYLDKIFSSFLYFWMGKEDFVKNEGSKYLLYFFFYIEVSILFTQTFCFLATCLFFRSIVAYDSVFRPQKLHSVFSSYTSLRHLKNVYCHPRYYPCLAL